MKTDTTKCCRTCEWFDGGGEALKPLAMHGDCLNSHSDKFCPDWNHVCKEWMAESETCDA